MPNPYLYEEPYGAKDASAALMERMRLEMEREKIAREHQEHLASLGQRILNAGLQLIPSEVLADTQVVVSRAVYDATKQSLR